MRHLGTEPHEPLWPRAVELETEQFVTAVRELWPERFSATYVSKRIKRLGVELAADPIADQTSRRFNALRSELDEFAERKLCVAPVDGIELARKD